MNYVKVNAAKHQVSGTRDYTENQNIIPQPFLVMYHDDDDVVQATLGILQDKSVAMFWVSRFCNNKHEDLLMKT